MARKSTRKTGPSVAQVEPSRLQAELAARILHRMKELGVGAGYRLVELELCEHFAVSRTPVRGALNLLAAQGLVTARTNRGYVLTGPVKQAPELESADPQDEEDKQLFVAIAEARNTGRLADECTQQEIVRIFNAKLSSVIRVLRKMSELGLVERKAGNGWAFLDSIDSPRAQAESYAFRRTIEPALFLQPTFVLDRVWAKRIKERHLAFRKRPWRDTLSIEFYDMNSDFHEQLARCSGNRYLLNAVQRQIAVRSFLNYHWSYGVERVHESIDEHLDILSALEAGDNARASRLMNHHLTASSAHQKVDLSIADNGDAKTAPRRANRKPA